MTQCSVEKLSASGGVPSVTKLSVIIIFLYVVSNVYNTTQTMSGVVECTDTKHARDLVDSLSR